MQESGEDDQDAEVDAQEALSSAELARRIELLQDVKILRSLNNKECRAVAQVGSARVCRGERDHSWRGWF